MTFFFKYYPLGFSMWHSNPSINSDAIFLPMIKFDAVMVSIRLRKDNLSSGPHFLWPFLEVSLIFLAYNIQLARDDACEVCFTPSFINGLFPSCKHPALVSFTWPTSTKALCSWMEQWVYQFRLWSWTLHYKLNEIWQYHPRRVCICCLSSSDYSSTVVVAYINNPSTREAAARELDQVWSQSE